MIKFVIHAVQVDEGHELCERATVRMQKEMKLWKLSPFGVHVFASTYDALEIIREFLQSDDIPVSKSINFY